ncbi:MAG: hypothetical protein WCF23_03825 [Candidatus Nitrosopolaris sp.]
MPQQGIKTIEYKCSRCEWKWIARKNGKDKPKPSFCPGCKTWMWDIERKNDMNKFYRWRAELHAIKRLIRDSSTSKWKKPTKTVSLVCVY